MFVRAWARFLPRSCLIGLPGPVWVLLSKIHKRLFPPLYLLDAMCRNVNWIKCVAQPLSRRSEHKHLLVTSFPQVCDCTVQYIRSHLLSNLWMLWWWLWCRDSRGNVNPMQSRRDALLCIVILGDISSSSLILCASHSSSPIFCWNMPAFLLPHESPLKNFGWVERRRIPQLLPISHFFSSIRSRLTYAFTGRLIEQK